MKVYVIRVKATHEAVFIYAWLERAQFVLSGVPEPLRGCYEIVEMYVDVIEEMIER